MTATESAVLSVKLRMSILEMLHHARASHIAPAFSIADIVAVLYGCVIDAKNDSVVLSKGHAGSCIYAALAQVGILPQELLKTYYSNGSKLSGHISHKDVPGVEVSTGSLGLGAPIAAGMALADKLDSRGNRVFTIIGDGECNEGSIWEFAQFAPHHKLANLTAIIDANGMQAMGTCDDVLANADLAAKFALFGWNVCEIDGHNHTELEAALSKVHKTKPTCIVARTVKGKGVSFMEGNLVWHYRDPQGEDYEKARAELEQVLSETANMEAQL